MRGTAPFGSLPPSLLTCRALFCRDRRISIFDSTLRSVKSERTRTSAVTCDMARWYWVEVFVHHGQSVREREKRWTRAFLIREWN